jgi:SAM-dependent methyltransferase
MHQSSMENMQAFRDKYLSRKTNESLLIFDLGSLDVNGSYKEIFNIDKWRYVGSDLAGGKNVDVVLKNPYKWQEVRSNSIDVFISGQAFEHIEFFWLTMLEVSRVLKPGGICCLIAPSGGFEHRYPVDCWRFYPDGFSALARFASLSVLETYAQKEDKEYEDDSNLWRDSVLIAQKPAFHLRKRVKIWFLHRLLNFFNVDIV